MKTKYLVIISIILWILVGIMCFSYYKFYYNNKIEVSNISYENTQQISPTPSENIIENSIEKDSLKHTEDSHIILSVIGDIMCHNSQYVDAYSATENTYDFSYVFENIKNYINSADLSIGNLETTFAGPERGYSNYPCFNTPEQLAWNLKDLGIDILSTANNHCMDTGYSGLVSTLNYLDQAGISHVGTNRSFEEQNSILIKEVNNIKIAFLSFTYGTNGIPIPQDVPYSVNLINEENMKNQLEIAKGQKPDLICVSMHWGTEYQTTQNETQENLANFLFANGADIILGSHPHVLQPMEKRSIVLEDGTQKDVFVIYSFGNFMSAQTYKNTQSSIILNLEINKSGTTNKCNIENISYIPIYMNKNVVNPKKYSILDLQRTIFYYESGIDSSLDYNKYLTQKNEFERIKNMYSEFNIIDL